MTETIRRRRAGDHSLISEVVGIEERSGCLLEKTMWMEDVKEQGTVTRVESALYSMSCQPARIIILMIGGLDGLH